MPSIEDMEERLNKNYFTDPRKYLELVDIYKGLGYKVYRNSAGKHKIRMSNDYLKEAFGGIFGGLF